jgi:steroid delta-isomerase-like uncharacterized protein
MTPINKNVVRRLYEEVWNKRKPELITEVIASSHALHHPYSTGSAIGPEAYQQHYLTLVTGFPDLRLGIEDIITEGDKVVVSWTLTGTHKGEFMGVGPTNKKVSVDGITINHIGNGKIMDSYVSYDTLGLLRQIGAVAEVASTTSASARK